MIIDYKTHKLTFGKHLPDGAERLRAAAARCTAWRRCAASVDGTHQANFVVDTGGEVISISQATATALGKPETGAQDRAEGVRHVRLGPRRVPDAGRGPGVRHDQYTNFPVVVLNLNAPSALLGFQLGGIVGHKFLSSYRVGIDLERSVLRLKAIS